MQKHSLGDRGRTREQLWRRCLGEGRERAERPGTSVKASGKKGWRRWGRGCHAERVVKMQPKRIQKGGRGGVPRDRTTNVLRVSRTRVCMCGVYDKARAGRVGKSTQLPARVCAGKGWISYMYKMGPDSATTLSSQRGIRSLWPRPAKGQGAEGGTVKHRVWDGRQCSHTAGSLSNTILGTFWRTQKGVFLFDGLGMRSPAYRHRVGNR